MCARVRFCGYCRWIGDSWVLIIILFADGISLLSIRICHSKAAATSIDNIILSIANCFKCGAGGMVNFQTMLTCDSACFNRFFAATTDLVHLGVMQSEEPKEENENEMKMGWNESEVLETGNWRYVQLKVTIARYSWEILQDGFCVLPLDRKLKSDKSMQ